MRVGLRECVAALLLAWLLLALAACGGSGAESTSARRGRVKVTITWPSSRAIPAETRSIRVVAKVLEPVDGPEVANHVVARPVGQVNSQIVLDNIPSVKVRLTATAHASSDGTGASLASGSTEVRVPEANSASASILLGGDADCVLPTITAFVSAVGDNGNVEHTKTGQILNASITRSSAFTVGARFDDPGVLVQTAAVSTINPGLLRGSVTNYGRFKAQFIDLLKIDAPGRADQPGEATIVMSAEAPSFGGATAATYLYLLRINELDIDIGGSMSRGSLVNGEPAPSGEVRRTFQFVYGQPFSFESELDLSFNILEPPSTSTREAEWNFVDIEGLPSGATVNSTSCNDWPTAEPV